MHKELVEGKRGWKQDEWVSETGFKKGEKSGRDVRWSGSNVRCSGSDVDWSGSDVDWSGSDMRWSGSDMRWSGSDVRCTGDDVRWSGNPVERIGELMEETDCRRLEDGFHMKRMFQDLIFYKYILNSWLCNVLSIVTIISKQQYYLQYWRRLV